MKERKFEVEEITVSKDEVRIKVNEETECYARELENGKIENGIGPIKKEVSEKSDAKNQKLNRKERIARRLEQIVSFGIHFLIILLLWSNPEVVEGYILMYIEISIFRIIGTSKSVKRLYEKMSKELMNKQSATMMMKNFLEKNQRLPKNFEEFKTASRMPSARAIVQNDF